MLGAGEGALQIAGAFHSAQEPLFDEGLSAASGTLNVRYGVGAETDAAGEISVLQVQGQSAANTFPYVFSGRAGVKHELVHRVLSVTAGVGGGGSAGGGFFSPDAHSGHREHLDRPS